MGKKKPLGRILKSGTGTRAAVPAARIIAKTKAAAAAAPACRPSRALPPEHVRWRPLKHRKYTDVVADIKRAEKELPCVRAGSPALK